MGLSFLIAGFIFFFLPNFSIIDILPDFFGCILIIIGLNKLADLTPGLYDARKAFKKVLYIDIVKFFLMFTVPFFGNQNGGEGYVLIFSFTFAVLDFLYTLPAFKALLNGFVYLGDRTNASILFKNQSEFSTLTTAFIIVKATLAFLPDLSFISNPDSSNVVSLNGGFYLSNYKSLLVGANFLITGLLGTVWLIYAVRYFNGIKNDKKLMTSLVNRYNTEILPQEGLFIRRTIKLSFTFIMIGGFLMADYLIDTVNVIPDFLGAMLFLLAALVLKKYNKTKSLVIVSLVFLITAIFSWIALCVFAINFPSVNIWTNIEAYNSFSYVSVLNIIKCIVQLIFIYTLFDSLKKVINLHTGSCVNELNSISLARKQQQDKLKKNNIFIFILGVISCISSIIRTFTLFNYPSFVVIDFLINITYAVYLMKHLTNINDAVEYRYL